MSYGVILADCPWEYRNFTSADHGAASAAYNTMTDADIAAIPVASWAARRCVLACWGTWPKLDVGLRTIAAWGFDYRTAIPWVKALEGPDGPLVQSSVGYWSRACSEVLLLATRGEPKRRTARTETPVGLLIDDEDGDRVLFAPRGAHSRKPDSVHNWLERTFVGPHLELFARRDHPGWTTWGLDTGFRLGASGVSDSPETRRISADVTRSLFADPAPTPRPHAPDAGRTGGAT